MPLFEYACKQCTHEFEALVRGDDTPECPACHATDLQRRLSAFAAHTASAPTKTARAMPAAAGCGHCGHPRGPGACTINVGN